MNLEFESFDSFQDLWRTGGFYTPPGEEKPYEEPVVLSRVIDAVNTSDYSIWIPRVINEVIKEAVEPMLIGESLLQKIPYTPGQQINIGALNAIADDFRMGEMEEYPEVSINMTEGTSIATIGKYGCAVKFSEEILRYSSYPIIDLHIRAVTRAMARYKEENIFKLITEVGEVAFDNVTPGDAIYGVTTGRAFKGAANGSITMDDIFDAMRQVMRQGFMPNTLIMHPMTWFMFVKDPTLRAFALNSGGGTFFATWNGNPAEQHNPWPNMNGMGVGKGGFIVPSESETQTPSARTLYPHTQNTSANLPSYFGFPLTIIVTPFMNYNVSTDLTDIIVCDKNELGYMVVDESLQVSDWTDPRNDIYKIKLRERYSLAIANEGQGVAAIKNVKVSPGNQVVLPATVTMPMEDTELDEIDKDTAIFSGS